MRNTVFLFARGVLLVTALALFLFAVELAADLIAGGHSLARILSFDVEEARHFNNLLNRNLNQLVGIAFTSVAIAVPLTANLYSLKFLEFFIKDPVNAAVLLFVVFTDASNTWAGYALKEDLIPVVQLNVLFVCTVICFTLLFPYLHYIFRFLHPNTLLTRLEGELLGSLRAAQDPRRALARRRAAADGVEHIANIAIRSVDRGDRNTAIESVFTLERVARAYWAAKGKLPAAWFMADQNFFLGFSSQAVDELSASHSWMEMKLFSELRQVMGAAVPRMPELVSTVAETMRKLGVEEGARGDVAVRELVVEFFNTFVRLALTRKDPRSVFIIFDQYRMLAEALNPMFPELGAEIAYYFEYYGQVARDLQLPFVVEAVAHDFGTLVRHAWQADAPNREQLLARVLHYDSNAPRPLPGVKKAHALLASYFLLIGQSEPAARVRASFEKLDLAFLVTLQSDLLHITREKYWEINERRMNIDYLPAPQREKLREFFEGLQAIV